MNQPRSGAAPSDANDSAAPRGEDDSIQQKESGQGTFILSAAAARLPESAGGRQRGGQRGLSQGRTVGTMQFIHSRYSDVHTSTSN